MREDTYTGPQTPGETATHDSRVAASSAAPYPDAETIGAAATNFEPLLSAGNAAKLLQIHVKTLQALARSGNVPCAKIGKYWRFRASVLDVWVREAIESSYQSRRVN
jgi:excisionase family DNA binding protein